MGIQAHPAGGKSGFRLIRFERALTKSKELAHGLPVSWHEIARPKPVLRNNSVLVRSCGWRIVILPIIPYDSPPCYHSSMRHLVVLFIHLIAILTQLLQPGGVRSILAESLLLKHQLLIVNRSRQRSPTLSSWDGILAGWMA